MEWFKSEFNSGLILGITLMVLVPIYDHIRKFVVRKVIQYYTKFVIPFLRTIPRKIKLLIWMLKNRKLPKKINLPAGKSHGYATVKGTLTIKKDDTPTAIQPTPIMTFAFFILLIQLGERLRKTQYTTSS